MYNKSTALRKLAEEQFLLRSNSIDKLNNSQKEKQIHELGVRQIELEMQNEEIRATQFALDETKQKYFDFFEFAPVGYLTLDEKGLITNTNLTVASMLGVDKKQLANNTSTSTMINVISIFLKIAKKESLQHSKNYNLLNFNAYKRIESEDLLEINFDNPHLNKSKV